MLQPTYRTGLFVAQFTVPGVTQALLATVLGHGVVAVPLAFVQSAATRGRTG